MVKYKNKKYVCSLDLGLDFIRGKWKGVILCHLSEKPVRFLELKRLTKGITHKILSEQLKALEEDGLIIRSEYNEIPPKVEYSLSKKGKKLVPALKLIENWAKEYFL